MRTIGALTRAAWLQARSYRLAMAMSVGGLVFSVVPTFFIAGALQPTMAESIASESEQYFAFMLVGAIAIMFVTAAISTLHGAVAGGISSGYFETLLMTRSSVPAVLIGLTSYGLLFTAVRAGVMLLAGWLLGAQVVWSQVVPALFILGLLVAAHWGIGLVAAALVIAFRTAGPLSQGVMVISVLFGGVYYPTNVIPSWLGAISQVTPLAYGLRALRRVLLHGAGLGDVWSDVAVLVAIGAGLVLAGALAIRFALRHARRTGSLGFY